MRKLRTMTWFAPAAYNHLDGDPVQYGGIYHDGGSANWHDTQNVIENVKSSCIFAHGSSTNISERQTWCNNTGGTAIQGQAHSLSCRIDVLNRTDWAAWPAEAQAIIAGAGRKSCWPNCPAPTPAPSPPCPVAPPPPPPGPPAPPPPHFGASVCNISKLSQRWLLSPGVKAGGSGLTTNIKSATTQAGCVEITGCSGTSIGTSYGAFLNSFLQTQACVHGRIERRLSFCKSRCCRLKLQLLKLRRTFSPY